MKLINKIAITLCALTSLHGSFSRSSDSQKDRERFQEAVDYFLNHEVLFERICESNPDFFGGANDPISQEIVIRTYEDVKYFIDNYMVGDKMPGTPDSEIPATIERVARECIIQSAMSVEYDLMREGRDIPR